MKKNHGEIQMNGKNELVSMPGSVHRSLSRMTVIIVLLLVLSLVQLPWSASSDPITNVSWFADGSDQKDIQFSGPGTDTDTAALSFQTGVTVQNVSFEAEGNEYLGEYPSNLTIDVGGDGTSEWRFAGTGYGSLGHQELLLGLLEVFLDGLQPSFQPPHSHRSIVLHHHDDQEGKKHPIMHNRPPANGKGRGMLEPGPAESGPLKQTCEMGEQRTPRAQYYSHKHQKSQH